MKMTEMVLPMGTILRCKGQEIILKRQTTVLVRGDKARVESLAPMVRSTR